MWHGCHVWLIDLSSIQMAKTSSLVEWHNINMPFQYWTSIPIVRTLKNGTSKCLVQGCVLYSGVWYSDTHCTRKLKNKHWQTQRYDFYLCPCFTQQSTNVLSFNLFWIINAVYLWYLAFSVTQSKVFFYLALCFCAKEMNHSFKFIQNIFLITFLKILML